MSTVYNPIVRQNATWEILVEVTNQDGTPFDLTDFTGQSQIKSAYTNGTVLSSPTVIVDDAEGGALRVHMTMGQTAALSATSTRTPPRPPLPVWDVLISNADNSQVYLVVSGDVTVKPGSTQWTP
jgi:hypothetical protein